MRPVIFKFADFRISGGKVTGIGPPILGIIQPPKGFVIGGVTRDSTGAALAGVTVDLYLSATKAWVAAAVSDAQGNYQFSTAAPATNYFCVMYKAGAPDVFATTLNTLIGI